MLGKRPFDRKDDMDKWLDENSTLKRGETSAPPPIEPEIPPLPAFKKYEERF